MLAESEKELQEVVDEFIGVCKRKLKVNISKNMVMVLERAEVEVY